MFLLHANVPSLILADIGQPNFVIQEAICIRLTVDLWPNYGVTGPTDDNIYNRFYLRGQCEKNNGILDGNDKI